jgi:uncharacterized protein (DUF1697 family)
MAEFRAMLETLGFGSVQTYIQSGNAVFQCALPQATLEAAIRDTVAERFGFVPETFVLRPDEILAALTDHPFVAADPARVHVFFLRQRPEPDEERLRALALAGDGWHIGPRWLTLHTPAGIGRSKLAAGLALPGPTTARNLRTLSALRGLADRLAHP